MPYFSFGWRAGVCRRAVSDGGNSPTGSVTISGTATQGSTLTASNTLADADGMGTISYQWKAGSVAISGATGSTYTLTQAEVGKTITVTASYTDGGGTAESVTSDAVGPVISSDTTPPVVTISTTETVDAQPALDGTVSEQAVVVVTIGAAQYTAAVSSGVWSIAGGVIAPIEPGDTIVTMAATDTSGNTWTTSATITRTLRAINIGAVQG